MRNHRNIAVLAMTLVLALATWAQTTGGMIQAELLTTLKVKKAKAGDVVKARAVTAVPLPDGTSLSSGAILVGEVRAVEPNAISISFDRVEGDGKNSQLALSVRAAMMSGGSASDPRPSRQVSAHSGSVIGMPGVSLDIDEGPQHASKFVSDGKDLQLKQGLQLMLAAVQ
jgi:hypothetical protein